MLNLKEPLGGNFCQKAFSNFNSKKTPSQKIKKSVFLKGIKFWLAIYKKKSRFYKFQSFLHYRSGSISSFDLMIHGLD